MAHDSVLGDDWDRCSSNDASPVDDSGGQNEWLPAGGGDQVLQLDPGVRPPLVVNVVERFNMNIETSPVSGMCKYLLRSGGVPTKMQSQKELAVKVGISPGHIRDEMANVTNTAFEQARTRVVGLLNGCAQRLRFKRDDGKKGCAAIWVRSLKYDSTPSKNVRVQTEYSITDPQATPAAL